MSLVIDKEDPEWEPLFKMWLQEGKPGWLAGPNGATYQVLMPSDDDIKFAVKGAFNELYASSSSKGMTHGR